MRMPRVRLTMRRLMAAVAIVALVLGVEGLRRRRAYYLERATTHTLAERAYGRRLEFHRLQVLMGEREARHRSAAGSTRGPGFGFLEPVPTGPTHADVLVDGLPAQRDLVRRYENAVGYHSVMRVKYERAVKCPWLAVGPDPQAPE